MSNIFGLSFITKQSPKCCVLPIKGDLWSCGCDGYAAIKLI